MTRLNPSRMKQRIGAFARLWAMVMQIAALMRQATRQAEAEAGMARTEIALARSLLAQALSSEPANGLTVDDFDIVGLYDASGAFNPDFALKPHVRAANRKAWRACYLKLRHVAEARRLENWIRTLTGMRHSLRRNANARRAGRPGRRSLRVSICARRVAPAALPALIPP